jgi:4-hydroxy-2-oxoglutarate aldolase
MPAFAEQLAGVFAPVVTTFKHDRLDLPALRSNLRNLAGTDLCGYLALGSNGEFRSLSEQERLRVLKVFAEEKQGKIVMVGMGCESTQQTLQWIRQAADMSFPFASILSPNYFPKQIDDAVLEAYYLKLADSAPIPIVLYNAPGFTGGVVISPACVRRLASHQNIAGIKDSSKEGPGQFLSSMKESAGFAVLAGSANTFYPSLQIGAVGGVLSLGNYLSGACCRLYNLFMQGDYAGASRLHHSLVRINRAVSGAHGVAGVKAAMDLMGLQGGEPRHPLQPLTAGQRSGIKAVIEAEGFSCGS